MLALHQATTAGARLPGATPTHHAARHGVAHLLAVVPQDGEAAVVAERPAGAVAVDRQLMEAAMEAEQLMAVVMAHELPMVEQPRTVEPRPTVAEHHTAETTARALHTEASAVVEEVERLAGVEHRLVRQSRISAPPRLEPTMRPHLVHTRRQPLVVTERTLRLRQADRLWMLRRLGTSVRPRPTIDMEPRLLQRRARMLRRLLAHMEMTQATIKGAIVYDKKTCGTMLERSGCRAEDCLVVLSYFRATLWVLDCALLESFCDMG